MREEPIRLYVYRKSVSAFQYRRFIRDLRERLGVGSSHNLPVLAEQWPPSQTSWIDIELYSSETDFVTVRVRRDNLYVDGYRVSGEPRWREFALEGPSRLIPDSVLLPFGGSYPQLQQYAHQGREDIPLGHHQLTSALRTLRDPGGLAPDTQRARALTVVIQMISEATRLVPIQELIAIDWENGVRPEGRHLVYENGWQDLSGALLRMDQNSQIPFTRRLQQPNSMNNATVAQAVSVLGILLFFRVDPSSRFRRAVSPDVSRPADMYQPGRPLLQILWVRIDDIDGENPGELYGTITATDGVVASPYVLFSRTTSHVQAARPGDHVELEGPGRAISASGSVAVELKLYDYDRISPDDEIVNETIYWNPFGAANVFGTPIERPARGQYGRATVCYIVLGNAAEAVVEVVLITGDGEDPADVHGTITASTPTYRPITLFDRSSDDYVSVRPGTAIPLLHPAAVVQMEEEITFSAHLWDNNPIFSDEEIANGSVTFEPQLDYSSAPKDICGKHGRIQVRVTWY